VRQPRAKTANALIAALNRPLISTSANISGSPTCRSGIEVFGTMDGRVDLVPDGGTCSGATPPCRRTVTERLSPKKLQFVVLKTRKLAITVSGSALMPDFSAMPEVFVSDASLAAAVSREVKRGLCANWRPAFILATSMIHRNKS